MTARGAGQGCGWPEPRPMESAPKDREIMLWARERWYIGKWDRDEYANKPRPFWYYSDTWRRIGCRAEPPTAWLPLPPPIAAAPSSTDDGRTGDAS